MTSTLGLVILFVTNPQKSAEFYAQILGKQPIEQSPTFCMFPLSNGVMLGLWSKYTAEPIVHANPGASEIMLMTDDVDDMYNKWGKLGVTIIQKPTDMDFGRTFVGIDPDGHRIRVAKLHDEK